LFLACTAVALGLIAFARTNNKSKHPLALRWSYIVEPASGQSHEGLAKGSSLELANTGNDLFDPISELLFLDDPRFPEGR
jgi:hypothetical protein